MTQQFVHLNLHTEYSLVDSVVRVADVMHTVQEDEMSAVALTDLNNLFAAVKFYQLAIKQGIKPILGVEASIASIDNEHDIYRIVLLSKDRRGYLNLCALITKSYLQGQRGGQPIIYTEWLNAHADGLIVLSNGCHGDVGAAILRGDTKGAEDLVKKWGTQFKDRYYLSLSRTGRSNEELYNSYAIELAKKCSIPLIATNDVRFITPDEFEAHEVRVCIHQGRVWNDPKRARAYSKQQFLRSTEEMYELFKDVPEALQNTVEVAKRCNVELEFERIFLPEFPIPQGQTTDAYLRDQATQGLHQRLAKHQILTAEQFAYRTRLDAELNVIEKMGYSGYFLIVADFTRWARENQVPVGPGRGSGAGSLVAYVLGITNIDPLSYDLLFERFLNPERVSMPDFDIDFCMEGRDRVIDYVSNRFGEGQVSQIITFGSMAARAVVRDVGRVLGHPYGFVDRIAKMIPFEIGMTLDKALEREQGLREQYEKEEDIHAIIDMAKSLEGLARNAGKHAGGVVIAPTQLIDFMPLYCESGGKNIITQLDKDDVEAIGLVKFDFLGLRTLTIIQRSLELVNQKLAARGEKIVDLDQLPLDDQRTYHTLQKQQTTAVFQLESSGIKDLIKRLKPDKFDDVVALVALYRPGPLQSGMVDDFILRKHGARVDYFHPRLEPILKQTYGVILYQEQVMQIAQVLAGYSLGEADLLRRAMGKKKPEEMAQHRERFVNGAIESGVKPSLASHIFDLMEKFAGYGFNKSHSVAYALLAYQTAWLKTHYTAEFMSAVLSSDMDNTDKIVNLIDECRGMGISVLPPDVNRSAYAFSVPDEKTILYGLGAIKGVGRSGVEHIVANRNEHGLFSGLDNFCARLDTQKVNRRSIEAMIRAGVFDCLNHTRASYMQHLEKALRYAGQHQHNNTSGQNDLFGDSEATLRIPKIIDVTEWSDDLRLQGERETLGLYLTGHPVTRYRDELFEITNNRISELLKTRVETEPTWSQQGTERSTLVGGLLLQVRLRNSPSGRIAFVTLDDDSGRLDVAIFADDYQKFGHLLVKDKILIVEGSLSLDEFTGRPRLRAKRILELDEARKEFGRILNIHVQVDDLKNGLIQDLHQALDRCRGGSCPVCIQYLNGTAQARLKLDDTWKISPDEKLLRSVRNISGVMQAEIIYRMQ